MATFSLYTCSYTLLLVLISVTATNGHTVDLICHQTKDPQLCLQVLGGPKFQDETLPILAELGFQSAQINGIGCQSKLESLMSSPKKPDPKMKTLLGQCKKIYDHVLALLRPGHEAVTGGRWAEVLANVTPVPSEIDQCEQLFNNNSPVHEESRQVRVAAEAILVIAKTANH